MSDPLRRKETKLSALVTSLSRVPTGKLNPLKGLPPRRFYSSGGRQNLRVIP